MAKKMDNTKSGKKPSAKSGDSKTIDVRFEPVGILSKLSDSEQAEHDKISGILGWEQTLRSNRKILWWHVVLPVVIVTLASAALSAFAFADRSLAKVQMGGLRLDPNSSVQMLEKQISSSAAGYKLAITYDDGSKKQFTLAEMGVSVDSGASVRKIQAATRGSLIDRLEWWQPITLAAAIKTDQVVLTNFINTKAVQISHAPKNASLFIKGDSAKITPEEVGFGSRLDSPQSSILAAAAGFDAAPLKLHQGKILPDITAANLHQSQVKLAAVINQDLNFTVAGQNVKATPTDIAGMLDLAPAASAKTVDVTVNSGKVAQYIDRISRRYIQPPRSRLITKIDGGTVVLDQGANGVDVINKDQTAASAAQKILDGKGVKIDLPVKYASAKTIEVQPYAKWIVVDTTTKRMYAYEQTNLVKSFLVSAGAPRTPTVTGTFAIYSKFRSQDMRGGNADGSRYFQPAVPYVNYFYKDYAIHGNYWRPTSYFGNINSSHGCVGTAPSDAAWIYNWAPIGTPVIVHT